jgi:CHAT domain-containing protein/Tfp pilus assembly protein PilF
LLGQLAEADDEKVELRLLSDSEYSEELDIITDELIDQYIEGGLPAEEQDQLERHFLRSSERRNKIRFALALKKQKLEFRTRKFRARRSFKFYLPIAASVLIVLGLSLGIWWRFFHQSDLNKGLLALQTAYREQRPVEARLSDFSYAPTVEQRGGTEKIDYVQRDRAASLLLSAVNDSPSAAAYHALGKYYLAERKFDKAIEQFEAALKLDPQNASIHGDLGAALLEQGKVYSSEQERGQGIETFAKSLEHLNSALKLNPSLSEALFNRALLYQYMMLPKQATEDWRKYLERDPNSKWADEARQHLRRIEEQQSSTLRNEEKSLRDFFSAYELRDDAQAWKAISRNYTSAGNVITNALIDSYLDLDSKGEDGEASTSLQALAYVGQLEFQKSGDVYTSDLARFYGLSDPQQRRALARAREQMRKGYKLFLDSKVKDALGHYTQAREAFNEIGDEWEATFAAYRIGHCYLLQPDLKRSEEIFAQLLLTCERKNYKWLLGQSLYRTASIRLTYNEYSESIDYAHRALKQSEQMQDTTGILNLLILLADEYRFLENEGQSLRFLQRALTLTVDGSVDSPQAWGIFTAVAFTLNSLGLHLAALEYQRESLRLALELDRPLLISRSYDYLGLTYGRMKFYEDALRNIDLAFEIVGRLPGERSGLELMANSSLHAGEIQRQMGHYDQAVEAYDRSIRLYKELDYPYFTYPAHKGKLLSFIAKGDDSATEEELGTVLVLFEQYRSKLTSENQRNTFFDVEQSIYDLAIDFAQSKKQNTQQAFEYSELSRARSLLDAMQQNIQVSEREEGPELRLPSTFNSLALSDIQQQMPPQAQIIQYAVLDNKLFIWIVNPTSITLKEVSLDSHALSDKVREYIRAVNFPSASLDAARERGAKELHDILIKPVEPLLDKTKLLCIVPDKLLHYVPFNALVSTATGRYLVQDYRLEFSPSSTVFVNCSNQATRKTGEIEERLLSVGDPSFDRAAFPSLRRLPAAGREAAAVATFYKSSRLLLRDDALESVVKSEVEKSAVAHFALHYIVDDHSNLLSKLVLAAEQSGDARTKASDGIWQSYEIYKIKLPHTRLVILSACQTGIEQQYQGEGAVSIARPFIVAGVPIVIASLWPVDSDSTERLMVSFHRYRTRDHLPSAEALRRAQLELLAGDDTRYRHPYYWAAFTAIGGYTEY